MCLGNICRSPTAEGVFTKFVHEAKLADVITVDSAGTGDYHVGEAPDSRSMKHANKRGYDLSSLRARQVDASDFTKFDYILAMDSNNLSNLQRIAPKNSTAVVDLFLKRFGIQEEEVPDPYYGGASGFEHVIDLVEAGSIKLLEEIKGKLDSKNVGSSL